MKGKITKANTRRIKYAVLMSSSLILTGFSGAILAQDEVSLSIEEVVVTARKREESIQDVSVAVTALTPAQLDKGNINRVQDLQKLVPNFKAHDMAFAGGAISACIRGMCYDDLEKSFEPAVPIVVDGVVHASNAGVDLDFFDLEGVEVLRGPQGTLFGRNTIGGVVNIKRTQPTGEWGLKVQADIEEDNTYDMKLVANMPLGDSGAGIKVSIRDMQSDSFMYNAARSETLKLRDLESASIAVAGNLGDNLYANLTVDYYNDNSAHNLISITEPGGAFCAVVGACRSNYDSEATDYTVTWQGQPFESGVAGINTTLNLEYEGEGFILKSITAQNDFEELMDICSWGTPESTAFYGPFSNRPSGTYPTDRTDAVCSFPVVRDQEFEQLSQEFQYLSNLDGPMNFTLGLFYLEAESFMDSGPVQNFLALHELEAQAAYADVVFELNDQWSINTGIRYTEEEKTLSTRDYPVYTAKAAGLAAGAVPSFVETYSDDNLTYKLILERHTSFGMIYGGVTTGYRSGGWQMRGVGGYLGGEGATSTPRDYGPFQNEDVMNYEIGVKSMLADGRVMLNLTAFKLDYEDKQEQVVSGGWNPCQPTCTFVLNVGEVEIEGYEAEIKAMVMENLIFTGAVGILDSNYTKWDYLGDDLSDTWGPIHSPDLTMNVGFDYSTDMWGGTLAFSGSLNYMDEVIGRYTPYTTDVFGTKVEIPSYEQLDLSVTFTAETASGGTFRMTVFGNDILEEGGRVSRTFEAGLFAFASTLKRQHFGMTIGYEF